VLDRRHVRKSSKNVGESSKNVEELSKNVGESSKNRPLAGVCCECHTTLRHGQLQVLLLYLGLSGTLADGSMRLDP